MADQNTNSGTDNANNQDNAGTQDGANKAEGTNKDGTQTGADNNNSADAGNNGNQADKTFTQTELNDIITKRLAKEKSKWEKEKDLPEIERLKKEREELATKVREREITDSFNSLAKDAGAKNIDRLLKIYRPDLTISEDGNIENAAEILASAKNDFPEFFSKGSADAGAGKQETKLTVDQQVDAEFAKTGRTHAFRL